MYIFSGFNRTSSERALEHSNAALNRHFHDVRTTLIFVIGTVGGGVQLGPIGTAATNRTIVPSPGDYDDAEIGGMIARGNRSTRSEPAPQTPHALPTNSSVCALVS
jgi:hypothetical protein